MKAIVLVRKLLGLSVATKSRCGFLIALVLIITIGVREAVRNVEVLNRNEAIVCMAVAFVGFLSWLIGRLGEAKRAESAASQAAAGAPALIEDPLGFLKSLKYWGLIFILSASALSVLAACRRPKSVLCAQPLPAARVTVTNIVTITNEAPRVSFPLMELQGLVVNGARSSALINGRVLRLGEEFSNVVLVAVDSEHVTVALEGQTNVLALRR